MNSKEFEVNFLNRLEKTESINMNPHIIYEEMVKSTRHVKIEETKWKSMDEFLEHLKTTGKALYKMTESGPTVRHGAPPPKILLSTTQGGFQFDEDQDLRKLVKKATKEDDQKEEKKKSKEFKKPMPLIRKKDGETKVQFSLNGNSVDNKNTTSSLKRKQAPGKKLNVQKKAKRQGWLEEGLVVKCLNKVIGNGKYYKKKGLVINIRDPHSKKVQLRMTEDNSVLEISMNEIETVIPALGKQIKVVNIESEYLGHIAELISLQEETFSATIKMLNGHKKGHIVKGIEYQHMCKFE